MISKRGLNVKHVSKKRVNWCRRLCGCFVDIIKAFKVQVFFQSFQSLFLLFFKNNDNSLSGPCMCVLGEKNNATCCGLLRNAGATGHFSSNVQKSCNDSSAEENSTEDQPTGIIRPVGKANCGLLPIPR